MKARNFNIVTGIFILIGFLVFALPTIIIDPFFHYHAPLKKISYRLDMYDERYLNNGIVKNFEYNAIITGTSMTENFKTSEMEELFGVKAVKVPFAGGYYKEIGDNVTVAMTYHPDVKVVIWGLDMNSLIIDKDAPFHGIADQGFQYPYYLTNKNPFDDVEYILNKTILLDKSLEMIKYTKADGKTTSFDEYVAWGGELGKNAVLADYVRPETRADEVILSKANITTIRENLEQNVVEIAKKYPDTDFYIFIPPYSIVYWDQLERNGLVKYYIDALQVEFEELLKCENIKLFAFSNNFELVCNLDNYRDKYHYSAEINSKILRWMATGEPDYLIIMENYRDYLQGIQTFYQEYEYDTIFE